MHSLVSCFAFSPGTFLVLLCECLGTHILNESLVLKCGIDNNNVAMLWEFFGICGVWKVLGQEWEGNVSVFITECLRHAE